MARRIPDLNAALGQGTLFDLWRFHAFFTTTDPTVLDTVAADKTHRQHAAIEHVHADLKEHRGSSARKPPRNRQVDHTPLLAVHSHTKANYHGEI